MTDAEGAGAKYQYKFQNAANGALGSNPNSWNEFSQHNCNVAANERESSRQLREQTVNLQNSSRCDLKAQNNAVDQAVRIRVNEMEQAKNELSFNRRETLLEISHAEQQIQSLKESIQSQVNPMQVAQTRYANREQRPNVELCHDHVEEGLKAQVHQLMVDTQNLQYQLESVYDRRKELRQTLSRIEDDLASKMLSLELDNQCLSLRS